MESKHCLPDCLEYRQYLIEKPHLPDRLSESRQAPYRDSLGYRLLSNG